MNRQEAELLRTIDNFPFLEENIVRGLKWKLIQKFGIADGYDKVIKKIKCPVCHGMGTLRDADDTFPNCKSCNGFGKVNNVIIFRRFKVADVLFRWEVKDIKPMGTIMKEYQETLPAETEPDRMEAYKALLTLLYKYNFPHFVKVSTEHIFGVSCWAQHGEQIRVMIKEINGYKKQTKEKAVA